MQAGGFVIILSLPAGMKFAIIADVHANLEAFQAVLGDAKEQRCTHYDFLGGFVGYCADPKACIDIVRAMNAPCVKGNHDEYCATDLPLDGMNANATKAVRWTRKQLAADDREWLRNLPFVRKVEDFTIVHATLDRPELWQYVFDRLAAVASLAHQDTQVCFFGHTHVPMAFVRDKVIHGGTYTKFKVEPGKTYFVNPGAAGQPRDNNPKAAYAIYDRDERTIELRRCVYDIATTQKKIRESGMWDDD
jgi:diadenosine tetraphosphatase ApaH/serine/threonine PP2A family protein phosphatase